jgi:tricorn protease
MGSPLLSLLRYPPEVTMRKTVCTAAILLLAWARPAAAAKEARLLRFPAIHDKDIVFTYAGDLYTVPSRGGVARRLTSHEGFEMFARFSPDGKTLAFTGQYDGNTEVYVMPAEGGTPRRLTFTATLKRDDVSDRMGPNNIVMGWTPDGKNVIFRSRMREHNDFIGQLYLVSVKGGLPRQLPLPRGGFCSYSPDGTKLAYNRVFREFRTWKRYRGGMADDVWVYDFQTKKTTNITNNPAQDIIPMWSGTKIYFLSDRDKNKRMNLFVHDLEDKGTRQLTTFAEFDCKFPSLGKNAIVFENGGYIYRFDLSSEKCARVPVRILEDLAGGRAVTRDVSKSVGAFEIAPDGKRALFEARGELFTVPAQKGATRNLTNTCGVHERNPKWSPDGKTIAFISDKSGEDEIWLVNQDGSAPPRQLTSGGDTYKYALYWSPDGKKIMWADKMLRLQYVDVDTKAVKLITRAKSWEISDYVWSPDSKWVAYAKDQIRGLSRVYLYSLAGGKSHALTTGWYSSHGPAFSGDGKYLFFISERDFNPIFSRTEWNHAYQAMSRVYFVPLAKDTPSPFKPTSDEVGDAPKKPKSPGKKPQPEKKKPGPVTLNVDLEGLRTRVLRLPVRVANYAQLASVGDALYYVRGEGGRRRGRGGRTLAVYDLGKQKETELGPVMGYEISADGKKMLVSRQAGYSIIDLPKGPLGSPKTLNLSGLEMKVDRHQEWKQIFHECWRQMRDFFYDPGMHGVDWAAVRKKYAPLVEHVNHRADLTYIIGEMIAELNCGHTYVGGGDMPRPKPVATGLLGAELEHDPSGYYKIAKILRGVNWDPKLRSPLTEIGVKAAEGDFIVAVNGRPTNKMVNIYEALVGTAGKQVTLTLNKQPREKGGRKVTVVPIDDEQGLYYYQMVQTNIKKVSDATGGKVGYIHLPDMQITGLNEFVKHFYPQLRKRGLIIDVRGNGGGNVSPQLIERLRRQIAMVSVARNTTPFSNPGGLFQGPMVCLLNEFSASDGDLFPYRFRKYKLGKLIGKRSWGGVVGIRGPLPLLDGGYLMKPEFAPYSASGKKWIIEGHGVDPDIVVDNDPAKEFAGNDEQLNKAVEVIKEELKTKGKTLPKPPPYPKK